MDAEAPALVDLGPRLAPEVIRHARLGLSWTVLAVLENWFRVRVSGPLPGKPLQAGEFVMVVRRYGDWAGWWIAPESGAMALARLRACP